MTKDFYFRLTITWMQMYDLLCILLQVDTNTSTSDMYLQTIVPYILHYYLSDANYASCQTLFINLVC